MSVQSLDEQRAWSAATVGPPASWYHRLSADGLARLEARMRTWRQPITELRLTEAERAACGLEEARQALEHGRGFVILHGLPLERSAAELTHPDDLGTHRNAQRLIGEATDGVVRIEKRYQRGLLSHDERNSELVKVWTKATEEVATAMEDFFPEDNPIPTIVKSGAAGNMTVLAASLTANCTPCRSGIRCCRT